MYYDRSKWRFKPPLKHTPQPGSKYARQTLTQEQSINLMRDGITIQNAPQELLKYGPRESWADFKLFMVDYFHA